MKRVGPLIVLVALASVLPGCGSTEAKLAGPPTLTEFVVQSQLLGRPMYETLVTPDGGGKGRPLLVFLHGYGGTPSGTADPAFRMALRRLGDRAPVVLFPQGNTSWWHDRADGPWGTYVLMEAIPAALARSGADKDHVAIGGISMGGFGALDLGRLAPDKFCAVGGHSPAVLEHLSDDTLFAFDNQADFNRHDLIRLAQSKPLYKAPVWIDVGDQDSLRVVAEQLTKELRDSGADVTYHHWPGGHAGPYWDRHWRDYLDFYADACS